MIGSRLGSYEITAKLGEGGMGEVYRATDSKLKRDVAIKVLPAAFVADPERLARFEREAQLLAQLHHPHIASIFGLEESGGTRALVMELVEGPTLGEKLEQGGLPLDEAVALARQIAEALEAAHEKGIIHRDLKPANVKLTPDGSVKVLDFGLAKALDPVASPSSPSASPTLMHSPTLTAAPIAGTQLGVILGTAAYMAPEQARGVAVDKRADIWAFGVLLHEMLTGRRLFEGELVTDVLADVLRKPIDSAALPATTPAAVRQLVRRCLERNPKSRLRDIGDARQVLEDFANGRDEEIAPVSGVAGAATPRRRSGAVAIAAAIALVAGLAAGWLLRRPVPPPLGAGARWSLAIPEGLTLATDNVTQIALSEDGRYQVAVVLDAKGETQLLLRTIDEAEPQRVPGTEGALAPFFSPDGAWIGFFRERSLLKVPTVGGAVAEVAAISGQANQIRGASWGRDGFIYFAPNVLDPIYRIPVGGGAAEPATKLDVARDERTHRSPQVLPGGKAVLYTSDTTASTEFYDDARIEAVTIATGERHVLIEGSSQARCCVAGRLIFARGGTLFAVPFDEESLTVSGAPEAVVVRVATDVSTGAVQFALSTAGAALWIPGGLLAQYELHWVAPDGSSTPVPLPPAQYNESVLSPDGRRVALVGGPGGASELWVADLERGVVSKLTRGESVSNPVWAPDGARIAYRVRASGAQNRKERIVWRVADGSRDAETLFESGRPTVPSGFTSDGTRMLFSDTRNGTGSSDVFLLSIDGHGEPELLLGGEPVERDAVISPDGRWLAYTSNESGLVNVYVRPFPAGEGRWQISPEGGAEPRWSPDMKALYYRRASDIQRVPIDARDGIRAGRPVRAVDRVSVGGAIHTYSITADGRILTPRNPSPLDGARVLDLDLDFARRVAGPARGGP